MKTKIMDNEVARSVHRAKTNKGCACHAKRTNTGNPNAMTGTMKAVGSKVAPMDNPQSANTRNVKKPLHWKAESAKMKGRVNPKRPDFCTAKTYTRNNEGAARK